MNCRFVRSTAQIAIATLVALISLRGLSQAQTVKYGDAYAIQGFSQPVQEAAVASPIGGIIAELSVGEGDAVRADDCLVKLDSTVHDARLKAAEVAAGASGEIDMAEAELQIRQSRLERITQLASRGHATDSEQRQAREDIAMARASLQRAQERSAQQQADYQRLRAEFNQHQIKAPFDGVVVEFSKQRGEYVGPGDAVVCTIADLSQLSVEFMLQRNLRDLVNKGDEVQVLFTAANKRVKGKVTYISPYPQGDSGTFMVKVVVDNNKGKLNAGQRCLLQGLTPTPARPTPKTRP